MSPNWFLLAIITIKTNLKLAYAVYCALLSTIFYITCTCNIYIWFLLLNYKMTKTWNILSKVKLSFFVFHTGYLLNQHRQLTSDRNFCGVIFCLGAIHKVRTLKQGNFLILESSSHALLEKNGVTKKIDVRFWPDVLPPSSYLHT